MLGLLFLSLLACAGSPPSSLSQSLTLLTPETLVSGLVAPFEGPRGSLAFALEKGPQRKLWLTGAKFRVLDADDREVPSDTTLSGASLQLQSADRHAELHGRDKAGEPLLLACDGRAAEFRLPAGYGLPLLSNETLVLTAQWKNEDLYRRPQRLRLKAELSYTASPRKSVSVQTLGSDWSWRSPPGRSQQSHPAPEISSSAVAAVPVLAATCEWVEVRAADSKPLLRLTAGAAAEGCKLDGARPLSLLSGSLNPEPVEQVGTALLLLYHSEASP